VKISATLITLNEEENLPRALRSLQCCDEVVVIDAGSTDRTCEVARSAGAKVLHRDWSGYADQKNFAAAAASHDWILSLDADEALSEPLADEIIRLKQSDVDADGFAFPRRAHYLGRWIRHGGWYPDRKVRLYRRGKARWVGDYVHERVEVTGRVAELRGDLLHYTCDSFASHIRRVDRYTTLAAEEIVARGLRVGWLRLWLAPAWTFVRTYLLQRGFLDGLEGFLIARMAGFYVFAKYAKARTLLNSR
jgi:glycosyltransferase involved in cell wall biosynthesis